MPGTRFPTEFNLSGFPGFETVSFLEPPYFGVTSYQNTAPLLQGVPQQTFSQPFTASNPLLPILARAPERTWAAARTARCSGTTRT